MTAGALTRPGERQRLIVRLGEIDWTFCAVISVIALAGGAMLYSVAGGQWTPWAAEHLIRGVDHKPIALQIRRLCRPGLLLCQFEFLSKSLPSG